MQLNTFQTKDGETITLGNFTVLVGPNNVGKSQTLRDLLACVREGSKARTVIVTDLSLEFPNSLEDFLGSLSQTDDERQIDHVIFRGVGSNLVGGEEARVPYTTLQEQFDTRTETGPKQWLLSQFGKFQLAFLDAESRLKIAASTPTHDPAQQAPQRLLQGLVDDEHAQDDLLAAFKDTFGMEIRLDYSALAHLYLRVAENFPDIPDHPSRMGAIMRGYPSLDEQGDGFRSFAGVLLSILLSKGRVLLIDEPEAFLHPAQARRLGYWVAKYAAESASQIIVATHNAHFLSGVLSSESDADIYRLNRNDDTSRFQLIDATTIDNLSSSPLLSSQPVLEAIFHRGAVVCEADSDRLFYRSVATRAKNEHEVLFLHAHNKQTLKDVVALLRAASIPCAAIGDIDLLNSDTDIQALLKSFGHSPPPNELIEARNLIAGEIEGRTDEEIIGELLAAVIELQNQIENNEHTLSGARSALRRIDSSSTKWAEVKYGGLEVLGEPTKSNTAQLIDELATLGIFIVPVGELESWIDVGTRRKKKWIVLALRHLALEGIPEGVSEFIGKVISHVRDN